MIYYWSFSNANNYCYTPISLYNAISNNIALCARLSWFDIQRWLQKFRCWLSIVRQQRVTNNPGHEG